jgi:NAD+ kinase
MILGVTGNPRYEGLGELLGRVAGARQALGFTVQSEPDLEDLWPEPVPPLSLDGTRPDMLMCFGGDGTLLRTVRLVGPRRIPIIGVKIGRVGFLTTATPATLDEALRQISAGKYYVEPHRGLSAAIVDPRGRICRHASALNDVVVHKAGVARVIRLRVVTGDEEIGAFASDGLIVATPTGSTAYSLSAGGPVVVPSVDALVVTPICPHTLAVRPIVVPGSSRITIELLPPFGEEEVLVSSDGQVGEPLGEGMKVEVTLGTYEALLVRLETEGFFSRMRRALQWGDLTDRERV